MTTATRAQQPQVIEAEPEYPVATMQPQAIVLPEKYPAPSALDARTDDITAALRPAYERASLLDLSDDEIAKLTARFSDAVVEIRPHDGLIYIPHIEISRRLNEVFRPGKWALIRRREWYDAPSKTMYGDYILVVRGCYVGESIGGHQYVQTNPKVNYSDALESTRAEALRRIAAKVLSCGDQVWQKTYSADWVEKYGYKDRDNKWYKREPQAKQAATPAPQSAAPPKPNGTNGHAPAKEAVRVNPAPKTGAEALDKAQMMDAYLHKSGYCGAGEYLTLLDKQLEAAGILGTSDAWTPAQVETCWARMESLKMEYLKHKPKGAA